MTPGPKVLSDLRVARIGLKSPLFTQLISHQGHTLTHNTAEMDVTHCCATAQPDTHRVILYTHVKLSNTQSPVVIDTMISCKLQVMLLKI